MSLIARKRAWASDQRRTKKLLLIALAEYADDQGFCWVGAPTLADRISEDIDYTQRLLGELVSDGDLLRKRRVGRGNCSIYCVVSTLSDDDRSALARELAVSVIRGNKRVIENTVLESSVSADTLPEGYDDEQTDGAQLDDENTVLESSVLTRKNTVLENTVLENSVSECSVSEQNTVLESGKHCTGVMSNERSPSASGCAESTQKSAEKLIDSFDDDDDARASKKRKSTTSTAPAHVVYLSEQGMGAAHLFTDCDPDATIADFNARIADNWEVAAIVRAWRIAPPRKGSIYERRVKADPVERSAAGAAAARESTRAARPGDAAYYTKRSSR